MERTLKVTISISTNPATAHIGRYFVDIRDTTGGRNLQMTTRVTRDPAAFLAELDAACDKLPFTYDIGVLDETGELAQLAR